MPGSSTQTHKEASYRCLSVRPDSRLDRNRGDLFEVRSRSFDIGSSRLSSSSHSSRSSPLLTACAVFLTIASLYVARAVLVPLALAVLFTFVLTPLVVGLERGRLVRIPTVVLVLAVCFLATGAVGWLVTGQLMQVSDRLPNYTENIHKKIQLVRGPARGGLSNVTATVQDVSQSSRNPGQ